MAKKPIKAPPTGGAESGATAVVAPAAPVEGAPVEGTPAVVETKVTTASAEIVVEDKREGREDAVVKHDEQKNWDLQTQTFPADQPPAVVRVRMGVTKNLGDYESARLDIEVAVPCRVEDVPAMQERAKNWITRTLKSEIKLLDERIIYSKDR